VIVVPAAAAAEFTQKSIQVYSLYMYYWALYMYYWALNLTPTSGW